MKCQFFFFFSLFFLLQPVKGEMDSNRQLFQVYADSIKITVSCLNDQIIHVQATPEGSAAAGDAPLRPQEKSTVKTQPKV